MLSGVGTVCVHLSLCAPVFSETWMLTEVKFPNLRTIHYYKLNDVYYKAITECIW